MNIFGIVRSAAELLTAKYLNDDLRQPNLTVQGNIAVEQILVTPAGTVPARAETDDGDIASGQISLLAITENYLFDTINGAVWVRAQSLRSNIDAQIETGLSFQGVISRLQAFNGATFDRLRCEGDTGDGTAPTALGNLITLSHQQIWNGAAYDRLRSASAAVQSQATKLGVLAVAKIGDWAIQSDPATAIQATITRAAGAAGVRHICTSITATFSAGITAGVATKVYLRDGLTGAGAILWSASLSAPVGDSHDVTISDLSIVGSAATAMTLEFALAGAAGTFQNVALTGYDV